MNEIVKKEEANVVSLTQESNLSPLVQAAMSGQIDTDKLNALLDIQQRHEKIEAEKAYTLAISQFRAVCPAIAKTRDAHNSKYAGLAETVEQIKSLLTEHGLSHSWRTEQTDSGIKVTCCIRHVQGHQECTSLSGAPDTTGSKNSIQAIGSTVTYLERYTLFAILGLASGDQDDDGNGAKDIEYLSEEQQANLQALIDETGSDKTKFLKWLKVPSLSHIQIAAYNDCVRQLERKRK